MLGIFIAHGRLIYFIALKNSLPKLKYNEKL